MLVMDLLMSAGTSLPALAYGGWTSPYMATFAPQGTGFLKLSNPGVVPTDARFSAAFSPNGKLLVFNGVAAGPDAYRRSGSKLTRLDQLGDAPEQGGVTFTPDGGYLFVCGLEFAVYSVSGETFERLDDPTGAPALAPNMVSISPDQTMVVAGSDFVPYLTTYSFSDGVVDRLPDPTQPGGRSNACGWSPDGIHVAVGVYLGTGDRLVIYKRSGDTLTPLSGPATMPAGDVADLAFSADGEHLAVASQSSPYLQIYKRAGDTFTKLQEQAMRLHDAIDPFVIGRRPAFRPRHAA